MTSPETVLQVFDYKGAQVRTVEKDGGVWWIAKDVCDILGLEQVTNAIKSLDNDEKMTLNFSKGHSGKRGGAQFMNVVNESGLYNLIFRSSKPEAKKFRRWVTYEVLPAIRKHGMYLTDRAAETLKNDPAKFNVLMANYLAEKEENQKLREQIDRNRAYTLIGQMVTASPGGVPVKDAAGFLTQKGIPTGQNRLFKRLRNDGLVCSRKGRQRNKPTQRALERGILNLEISGGMHTITVVTPEGLKYLSKLLTAENYPMSVLFEQEEDCEPEAVE